MRSSGTRTMSRLDDFTCDNPDCLYDGEGALIEDYETQQATWHCPECGGEQDLDWERDDDHDRRRE